MIKLSHSDAQSSRPFLSLDGKVRVVMHDAWNKQQHKTSQTVQTSGFKLGRLSVMSSIFLSPLCVEPSLSPSTLTLLHASHGMDFLFLIQITLFSVKELTGLTKTSDLQQGVCFLLNCSETLVLGRQMCRGGALKLDFYLGPASDLFYLEHFCFDS